MRYAAALVLFVHGFAHTVGFVVPWQITSLDEAPYKTTVLAGKVDLGHVGIRIIGLLWLLGVLLFFAAGALLIGRQPLWRHFTLGTSLYSLVLCILGIPESRLGIPINIAILLFVLAIGSFGWASFLGV